MLGSPGGQEQPCLGVTGRELSPGRWAAVQGGAQALTAGERLKHGAAWAEAGTPEAGLREDSLATGP